jgi:3,4-dehydroadipyl-CoA semialdehyde dehydrogenase
VTKLSNYVGGRWQAGSGDTLPLHNPATEETIATVHSGGIDLAEALAHTREHGGPALRAMTFPERAALLKQLSAKLHEHRDELLDLSTTNGGNTRGDGKFDVDGATGTLAAYASFGKDLPARPFLSDGEGVQLGRTARFHGQHILVPKPGVAVHINAFNFPCWGMAEKLACAVLAGVPVISKAGTPSAWVAMRAAQILVDSGLLPGGAFQFLACSAVPLLDLLGPQDTVAFTGSARTGALIRGNTNLVRHNVRLNIEADSVNASVLGPDVLSEGETFDVFLANLALDITQKAGQKCTAVRRILVPRERVAEIVEALVDRLSAVKVGDPADEKVKMGPLASAGQLRDVRQGIAKLAKVAKIACGGEGKVFDKGYFVAPTLLVAEDPNAAELHADEVFGPVAALMPYDGSAAQAIQTINLGGGGLVAAVYSDDREWTDQVVLGIAPWHGRVWTTSDKVAAQSLPPGMVLPASIHGGPGRAGGGEELGGLRGLSLYLQRTALQGYQGHLARSFGPPGHTE